LEVNVPEEKKTNKSVKAATVQLLGSSAGSEVGGHGQNHTPTANAAPVADTAPAGGDLFTDDIPF
jgi:hypothetical protein